MLAATLAPTRSLGSAVFRRSCLRHASTLSAINQALRKGGVPQPAASKFPVRSRGPKLGGAADTQGLADTYAARNPRIDPARNAKIDAARNSQRYPARQKVSGWDFRRLDLPSEESEPQPPRKRSSKGSSHSQDGRSKFSHDTEGAKSEQERRSARRRSADAEPGVRRPQEVSALYQDVLDMPFAEKDDFTAEKWDRLMVAIRDAETRYIDLLPTRPKELPSLQNKSDHELRRELKHGLKDALKERGPRLEEPQKEWIQLVQHMRDALDVAKRYQFTIPQRRFWRDSDPESAQKAFGEQFAPGSPQIEIQRPLSQDAVREVIRGHVEQLLIELKRTASPSPTHQRLETAGIGSAKLALGKGPADGVRGDPVMASTTEGLNAKEKESVDVNREEANSTKRDREEANRKRMDREEEESQRAARKEEGRKQTEEMERRKTAGSMNYSLGFTPGAVSEPTTSKFRPANVDRDTRDSFREDSRSTTERPRHETEPRQKTTSARHETSDDVYVSIPYTTAASEFIYGTSVVYAALKAKRRKLYTLYIYNSSNHTSGLSSSDRRLQKLAREADVKVRLVKSDFLPTMDKMASGRPHNGVILEASPLPFAPIKALGPVDVTSTGIPIQTGEQSLEQRAVNGVPETIPYPAHTWRKPFVLLLDGILDPGNLGNILRTAYFYGVDAVAICVNTCAPVNLATVQKAASGAAEALTLVAVPFPAAFVSSCAKNGWQVFASVAPNAAHARGGKELPQLFAHTMSSPLAKGPGLLMLGAEGEGLRQNLLDKATHNVSIRGFERRRQLDIGVESLNVATASAVLVEAFCRKPGNLEDVIERERGHVAERII